MFDTREPAVFYDVEDEDQPEGVTHRVWLRRRLAIPGPRRPFKPAVWVLHNPSVAGRVKNDPTARRGISFSIGWDCTDMIFVNAATQVATDANHLDPSALNCAWSDWALTEAARMVREHNGIMIAAWGSPKGKAATQRAMAARFTEMRSLIGDDLHYLRLSPHGWPEHPLYLPLSLEPTPWTN